MPIKITHIQHTNKQDRTPLTRQVEDREKRKQQVTAYKKKERQQNTKSWKQCTNW